VRLLAAVSAVFVIGSACSLLLGLELVNAPTVYGNWPGGVTRRELASAVMGGFRTCAAQSTAAPAGCPQAVDGPVSVSWKLAGDPLQGAGYEMMGASGTDRQFQVWGTYAMVATSTTGGGGAYAANGPYIASVLWTQGSLHLSDIRDGGFQVPRPSTLTDGAARQALASALGTCGRAPSQALCPDGTPQRGSIDQASIRWDGVTGVLHLQGAFASSAGRISYDALIVKGLAGAPVCYYVGYSSS
jgi:hypothetical protein